MPGVKTITSISVYVDVRYSLMLIECNFGEFFVIPWESIFWILYAHNLV